MAAGYLCNVAIKVSMSQSELKNQTKYIILNFPNTYSAKHTKMAPNNNTNLTIYSRIVINYKKNVQADRKTFFCFDVRRQ